MPTLEIKDSSIQYECWRPETGATGDTLTLINGHTRTLSDFRAIGRNLTNAGLTVVVLDNRGSGKTKSPLDFTVDDMVEDVIAILDALGVRRTHVLGISMGGLIAQTIACRYPDRVDQLVLVSTCPSRKYIRNNEQGWVTGAEGVESKMASYFAADFIARNQLLFDSMVKQTVKAMAETDFLARAEAQRKAVQSFTTPKLEAIAAETLVIHGLLDVTVDPEGGRELVRKIPRSKLLEIPGAGHLLLAEKPKELFEAIKGFVLPGQS